MAVHVIRFSFDRETTSTKVRPFENNNAMKRRRRFDRNNYADRSLRGSHKIGMEISVFFRNLIGACSFRKVKTAMSAVKIIGRKFQTASPHELIIGNIARRVLKMIRDCVDMKSGNISDTGQDSLSSLLSKDDGSSESMDAVNFKNIKADVIQCINEDLVHNLEDLHEDIAKDALDYIHPGEVILTYGASETIKCFLSAAKKRDPKRHFDVLVAESSRVAAGHKMASSLARSGVNTTLIANSAIFAMMARVDKVIVGANAVMANGGLIGCSGLHALALAAKHHSVPLVCVTGLYVMLVLEFQSFHSLHHALFCQNYSNINSFVL